MATNFPAFIDTFVNPISGEPLNAPNQANLVTNINDAILALQNKVGVDGSSNVNSLDYLINNLDTHAITYVGGTGISVSSPISHTSTITNTGVVTVTSTGSGITINNTDPHNPVISVSGGSGTWPNYSGSGTPISVVTPSGIGKTYVDTSNGALYLSNGTTNTSWAAVGGRFDVNTISGVSVYEDLVQLYGSNSSTGGVDIENKGPAGITIADNASGGITIIGNTPTSPVVINTGGAGIQIAEIGNGGVMLCSNTNSAYKIYLYTADSEAHLASAPLTPAFGYTQDGNIFFNNGSGWAPWTGGNTKEVFAQAAPGATPTLNTDIYGVFHFTGVAANITSMTTNLTGTPADGDSIRMSFTDNGTARTITWGAKFEASTQALPTTTVISTRIDIGFIWNTETSKWRCVSAS